MLPDSSSIKSSNFRRKKTSKSSRAFMEIVKKNRQKKKWVDKLKVKNENYSETLD